MRSSARLQLLICLMVYAGSAHSIMVKYGTKGGPIEPPVLEPSLPPPQPYRTPAPVWEERSYDGPDPNAQWRPQAFKPQPRYTQVVYNSAPLPINNAQRFVNSYLPNIQNHQPIQAQPVTNYFTPSQILSSQSLPGIGLRYFLPAYINDAQNRQGARQDDAKHNEIQTNDVGGSSRESSSDLQWKLEKDATTRFVRKTQEAVVVPVYQWPAYVPHQ